MSGSTALGRIAVPLACLALWAACCAASPALADRVAEDQAPDASQAVRITDVRAGLAGRSKVGFWTPFTVELQAGGSEVRGHVEIVLPDGDGVPSRVRAPAGDDGLVLRPGERRQVPLYAKLGQLSSELTVAFRGSAGLLATRRFRTQAPGPLAGVLPSSATLFVVVSGEAPDPARPWMRGGKLAHVSQLDELPRDWWGYAGIDALILATGDEAIASQLAAAGPQLAAIDQWVRMGGRLILSVGRHAERLLADGAPLAPLVPGRLEAMVPLRQSTALETFADTLEPVSADARFELLVPKLADARGQVEAFAGSGPRDLPLVVRAPHGFGEVVFVAFDLDRPPIANWKARPQLFEKLLRRPKGPDDEERDTLGEVTTLGFVDLSGQLRGRSISSPACGWCRFGWWPCWSCCTSPASGRWTTTLSDICCAGWKPRGSRSPWRCCCSAEGQRRWPTG